MKITKAGRIAVSSTVALASALAFAPSQAGASNGAHTGDVPTHSISSPRSIATAVRMSTAAPSAVSVQTLAPTASVRPAALLLNITDLCATNGTTVLPDGSTVAVWGYVAGDCTGDPTVAAPGGPVITADEGETVTIVLHNRLGEDTGLLFQGQPTPPDLAGGAAANTGTKTYTFKATQPGTYLYEAGLLKNADYQVAMGLYGAFVVRSATPGKAYGDSAGSGQDSSYSHDAVLVLSEIDPALNASLTPAAFDMRSYAPKYGLINGKAYPGTEPIVVTAGTTELLRYVNAGVKLHSLGALGVHQEVIAYDGSELRYAHTVNAETFAPGQTADVLVQVPASATDGTKFAIYDASLSLHNSNSAGTGGMMTFMTVGSGMGNTTPVTTGVAAAPNRSDGSAPIAISATVASSIANISAAEYFVDTVGTDGTGQAMTGPYGPTPVAVAGTIPASTLALGNHTIYVHGQDSNGTWGATASVLVTIVAGDTAGPITSALALSPANTNGSVDVTLTGTANDTATGGSNIVSFAYSIDGATAVTTTLTPTAPIAALSVSIPKATVNALAEGKRVVSVTSKDGAGNTGPAATINLNVDKSGPTVAVAVVASPTPNNGTIPFSSSVPAVRVTGTFTDTASNLVAAEGFFDGAGTSTTNDGTGFVFTPVDGVWGGLVPPVGGVLGDAVLSDIPLATIAALPHGIHIIYVHAKDVAGNWGPRVSTQLNIDKVGPTTTVTLSPALTKSAAVTVTATASDVSNGNGNVGAGEYFIDGSTTPTSGTGTAMTVSGGPSPTVTLTAVIPAATVGALADGTHLIRVHGKDALGNWGALGSATLTIDKTGPVVSAIAFSPTASNNTAVLVSATATDASSNVAGGEFFIDGGANPAIGTGTAMTAAPAALTSTVSATIPAATVTALTTGNHTIRVRAKDAFDNWGALVTKTLLIDHIAPNLGSVSASPTTIILGSGVNVTLTLTGATDTGGSGVVGGEYWLGSIDPGAGNGTSFGLPGAISIPATSLAVGANTISARVRDAAGNWSVVRTIATPVTVIPDAIFSNSFTATATPWGWTSATPAAANAARLDVTAAAALDSSGGGLQAAGGNTTNFVQYTLATPGSTYDAKFLFNPNGKTTAGQDIFAAATANGFTTNVFHVRYRRPTAASNPEVQIQLGATTNSTWTPINGASVNTIQVVWQSGTSLTLYVNGTVGAAQTLTTSNVASVGAVRLGSVTSGGGAAAPVEYFDGFASKYSVSPLLP